MASKTGFIFLACAAVIAAAISACAQTPISFSNIATRLSSDGSATIVEWTTNVPASSQVEYWFDSEPHLLTPEVTALSTDHVVTISGLPEGRFYSYRAWSRNQPAYADSSSDVAEFHTLPPVSSSLANGGFENVTGSPGHSLYPWVPYPLGGGASHRIDGLVGAYPGGGGEHWLPSVGYDGVVFAGVQAFAGSYFLGAGAHANYKNGGAYQRVFASPGELYTLTARYVTHRSGGENGYTKVRVGVDPSGGVDPAGAGVKWWSGYSETNDHQWHSTAVTVTAGDAGVATVFLEFQQLFALEWHVGAIDGVAFGTPSPMSIGALKASKGNLGAMLANKIVTYVHPNTVRVSGASYTKVYVQEDDRTAGVAVLLPVNASDYPVVGNKLTVIGALGVFENEASFVAESWNVDHGAYPLPKPLMVTQAHIGGAAENQPAISGKQAGPCNVGLRVRVFGRVRDLAWGGVPGDMTVYIDDGSNMLDGTKIDDPANPGAKIPLVGIRAYLYYNYLADISVGDYIAVTGPLSVQLLDPNDWPNDGDEYYIYSILTNSPEDWDLLWH